MADWIGVGAVYNFRQRPPEVSSKLRSLVISLIDLLDEISRDDNSGDKSVMSIEALSKFRGCIFVLCSMNVKDATTTGQSPTRLPSIGQKYDYSINWSNAQQVKLSRK